MNAETTPSTDSTAGGDTNEAALRRSRQAWQQLGRRLRSVTPSDLMRLGLTIGALVGLGWFIRSTWVALLPFIIGGVIAYILLPLVNRLDRFMPRFLAVLVAMSGALLVVGFFLALLVPILVEQIYFVYLNLPGLEEARSYLNQLRGYVETLPEPTQAAINDMYEQATVRVRENLDSYTSTVINLTISTVISLSNTIGFVLGLLVVPTWLLTVLHDQPKARAALTRLLPVWLRGDAWAVLRIVDRSFGAFIRGQLLIALAVAGLIYLGLELLRWALGLGGNLRLQLLLAMIAGLTQLIPSIGPFLGVIPAVLIGLTISVEATLLVIGLYIAVQWLVANTLAPRVERSIVDVHPAILILIIVGLSQFGWWWVLLAAPVTAMVRDLFRYTYGRFGATPRPAGLLPGETAVPKPSPQQAPVPKPRPGQRSLTYGRPRYLRQSEQSDTG